MWIPMRRTCRAVEVGAAVLAAVLGMGVAESSAQSCLAPYEVTREEIRQAMSGHGAYGLTTTTTSTRFGAEALLAIVRRRQQQSPVATERFITQADWFAAHLATAGVAYADKSGADRAGFEHNQDILVGYGPRVVTQVAEGAMPIHVPRRDPLLAGFRGRPRQFQL